MDKILVIDDSPVQIKLLSSILQESYEVTACRTAREGLAAALTGEYSLILLDIVMPELDGFSVLQKLQESAATRYIPVILITGLVDMYNEEKGLTLGAVDYITKPFNPVIVRARVNIHVKLYQYRKKFREEAMQDTLTGVANRRNYETYSSMRWRESMRLGLNFSACMFDIDKFKVYNDTYGHPAGDKVLASVAQTIASRLQRSMDFFARYGGEEFVAVVVGEEGRKVYEHMRTIRQAVEALHIPAASQVSEWVTVSMGGVTVRPREGDSYDDCLKIADAMLYDAKRLGRNRVVWSDGGREQWRES